MENVILILRPHQHWNIVGAELKRVAAMGRYMQVERTVRPEDVAHAVPADSIGGSPSSLVPHQLLNSSARPNGTLAQARTPQLHKLATLCDELRLTNLYARYANKKMFSREADFWASADDTVRLHVKRQADRRLTEVVRLADRLDIPILYAAKADTPLHIDNRLHLKADTEVMPLMHFRRHADGISYRLQLRIGEQRVVTPSEVGLTVIGYDPGLFVLGGCDLMLMGEGFSAKLLLPFVTKTTVEIPRRMENDYFRRFIMRNVAKATVQAEGFDICDSGEAPVPQLTMGHSLDGTPLLQLSFRYGEQVFYPYTLSQARVTLREEDGTFRFIRQLRDMSRERQYANLLRQAEEQLTGSGTIRFETMDAMMTWLWQHAEQLRRQGFSVVQPSDEVYYIGPLSVEQSSEWHADWLQTDVTIVIDDGRLRLPLVELRDTILRGERVYMLPTGERLLIPEEWLKRYNDLLLVGLPRGRGFMRHRSQVAALTDEAPATPTPLSSAGGDLPRGSAASLVEQSTTTRNSSLVPPQRLRATLRPYQQAGYEWLWHNFEASTGCCLSDEMGLGKTLQTIALLLKYKEVTSKPQKSQQPQPGMLFTEEEMRGDSALFSQSSLHPSSFTFHPSLVVAPASVVHNWLNELRRFAPSLSVCNYTGDAAQRREKRHALMRWDIAVTTYGTLRNDIGELEKCTFGIVVFDESQAFKTSSSTTHQTVARLQALHRIALSGTPVENNVGELWSLMSILNPNLLGSHSSFQRAFAYPITRLLEAERTTLLRRLVAPYFLKRTKEEVLSDLPERQDEVVVCPMTDDQTHRYAEELSKARNQWFANNADKDQDAHRSMYILAAIQRLRRIANGEGKMNAVFERLEQLRGTRHKVLIFSEYVSMLERVGEEMRRRQWSYDLLTGQTQQREQVIAHFQQTVACQFFLISLKAGGVGLNLTAADYVMLLDPWWNLAAEEQAIARAHRIGQHQPVFVYRFVSENTLEQQILTLQERKQTLIDSVMPFISK